MSSRVPLSVLLSQALVAFTVEFDNEFEHRMPHGTTVGRSAEGPRGPWLASQVMWSNVLRYVEPDGVTGEFAVIVQPDIKGKGLASRLMRRLIDWARARGMHEVMGQVLADNAPMLAFMRHLGFDLRRLPEEPDVMEARLSLI